MTRNEVKELLPIMQAFAEGKTIEERIIGNDNWIETDEIYGGRNNDYDYRVKYRVKPTPKYRPFKNAEECWAEMLKHQPFGWIKPVNECTNKAKAINISSIGWDDEYPIRLTDDYDDYSFEYLYKEFTFMDGTPFGILEEE